MVGNLRELLVQHGSWASAHGGSVILRRANRPRRATRRRLAETKTAVHDRLCRRVVGTESSPVPTRGEKPEYCLPHRFDAARATHVSPSQIHPLVAASSCTWPSRDCRCPGRHGASGPPTAVAAATGVFFGHPSQRTFAGTFRGGSST